MALDVGEIEPHLPPRRAITQTNQTVCQRLVGSVDATEKAAQVPR